MNKVGLPKGLIRYASEDGIAKKQPLRFTPRIAGYSALLIILLAGLSVGLAFRSDTETTILRTPGMLYQKQPDGTVSNLYNFKIVNKTTRSFPVEFRLESIDGEIIMIGESDIQAEREGITEGEFFLKIDPDLIRERKTKLKIGVYSGDELIERVKTNFMGPATNEVKKAFENEN
jgi:polyferredoxin